MPLFQCSVHSERLRRASERPAFIRRVSGGFSLGVLRKRYEDPPIPAQANPAETFFAYSHLVMQMRTFASGHRLSVEPDLIGLLDSLDIEELTALADYLSRMRELVVDRARMNDDGALTE